MKKQLLAGLAMSMLLVSCAPEVQVLQSRIKDLEETVQQKETANNTLQSNLERCNSLADTLGNEKQSKDQNLTHLKAKTRLFLKNEYDTLNRFSKNKELMDYMGGEVIPRKKKDGSNMTVINLKGISSDSVIYMLKGMFDAGTTIVPQLFRNTEKGIVCIWQGKFRKIDHQGKNSLEFDPPLTALKGDYFGVYFPDKVTVPYDTRTGSFIKVSDKIELGELLPNSYSAKDLSYSLGITGFLN